MTAQPQPDGTTGVHHRGRLTHDGPCGPRVPCWNPACRASFPGYRTVEVLAFATPPDPDWDLIARCHHGRLRAGELDAHPHLVNYIVDAIDGTVAR